MPMIIIVLILMFLLITALVAGCVVYNYRQFSKLSVVQKIENKWLSRIIPAIPFAVIIISAFFIGAVSALVILIHLTAFMLLCNLIGYIVKKLSAKNISNTLSCSIAVIATLLYMGTGWYFAHHVYETSYSFETAKALPKDTLRIVQIADSHLGITLDGEGFTEQIERIQKTNPDILVITGDFVDDDSNKADMIKACEALGKIKTTYGVYFTFGNHDKGYFEDSRNFTKSELKSELLKNDVQILEDEVVLVADTFYIIGRQDKSEEERKSIDELTADLDKSKYMLVLDHQPNDYDNEVKAQADLVLSGHTHGGHIFPAGIIGLVMGANDKVYGSETIENTDFVVTSGISGWAIPFKTGAISEYVVIDLNNE